MFGMKQGEHNILPMVEAVKMTYGRRGVLMECIAEHFDGWTPKPKGWQNWFPKLTTGPWVCSRASSGILALHYARQWMGTKLHGTLSPVLMPKRRITKQHY